MYGRNRGYQMSGGIPGATPMVQRIIVANSLIWLLQLLLARTGVPLTELGAVTVDGVFRHLFIWQPFTYMWLHDPHSPLHLLFNMLFFWMTAPPLEMVWGSRRFLRFYITCGVGAGFLILAWNALASTWDPSTAWTPTLGASGAIYGVVTAFTLLWPDRTIMLLFPPIPIKAIWFVPVLFVLQFILGGDRNVSYIGHLGGVLVAAIILRSELRRALGWRSVAHRWHRLRMRNRLRAVRREEFKRSRNSDDDQHTYH
ncbi:MAG TPA: rhomboid family intramembrane serine protease [Myxococcota bacterium]|nr:rhomboid family intramembrane serine protease [Myxococcota bacterium]